VLPPVPEGPAVGLLVASPVGAVPAVPPVPPVPPGPVPPDVVTGVSVVPLGPPKVGETLGVDSEVGRVPDDPGVGVPRPGDELVAVEAPVSLAWMLCPSPLDSEAHPSNRTVKLASGTARTVLRVLAMPS